MGQDEGALFPSGTQRQLLFLKKIFFVYLFICLCQAAHTLYPTQRRLSVYGDNITLL